MPEPLPTYEDACGRIDRGGATVLDHFIHDFEPQTRSGARSFRQQLLAILAWQEMNAKAPLVTEVQNLKAENQEMREDLYLPKRKPTDQSLA